MKTILFSFIFLIVASLQANAQEFTSTIRGQVIDKDTKMSLPGANVILNNTNPPVGTTTDMDGYFKLENVPAGRQGITVTFLGFEPAVFSQLEVNTGKEVVLTVELTEKVSNLKEVVISAESNKGETINKMAAVSARTFSVEESQRYAGSRNDVSRMATNFAGVQSGNDAVNDIIIRGNSANGLLWRLEGVDIPNPNHFGNFGATGGPVSMLNNNVLSNSDFFTGAFPSEYGNALSGVFDLKMRTGNSEKHEFLGQVGFNGFEVGAEGPLNREKRSSYLVNYRYSTLGVFKAMGIDFGTGAAVPEYDDVTFKFSFPKSKIGNLEVFGIGGRSSIELMGSEIDTADATSLYGDDNLDIYNDNRMGVIGVSQRLLWNNTTYSKLTLAGTYFENAAIVDTVDAETRIPYEFSEQSSASSKLFASFFVKKKFDAKNNAKVGFIATQLGYDLNNRFKDSETTYQTVLDDNDNTFLIQPYVQYQLKPNEVVTVNLGVHSQYLTLNNRTSIEPRAGIKWQVNEKGSLNAGYGLHAQMPDLIIYNQRVEDQNGVYQQPNTNLDFQKAHHFILGYDYNVTSDLRLKSEIYYQQHFNSIVSEIPSAVSLLNYGQPPFGYPDSLEFLTNGGSGRNFGIELTVERFLKDGFYYMATVSVYDSKYKGSDGVERSTAFDNRFVTNLVGGKEFELKSKKKKNFLVIDVKGNYAGGQRYTPVDIPASNAAQEEIYLLDKSYTEQFEDYFRLDLDLGFKSIGKKFTQDWSITLQNITNRRNAFFQRYDALAGEVRTINQLGLFIVPQWRITF